MRNALFGFFLPKACGSRSVKSLHRTRKNGIPHNIHIFEAEYYSWVFSTVQINFEPSLVFRQMETELIDKLDILINENKGSFWFSPLEEKR